MDGFIHSYKSELEIVFSNNKNQIVEFAKNLENTDYSELPAKILEYFDCNEDNILLVTDLILGIIHYHLHHNKEFNDKLETSSLDDTIKENIQEFIKTLSQKMINKLNLFYFSKEQMSEEQNRIHGIGDTLWLKSIYDHKNNSIGQLPVVSLKIHTNKNEDVMSYVMTMEDLTALANIFNSIITSQNKSIDKYKEKLGDSLVV